MSALFAAFQDSNRASANTAELPLVPRADMKTHAIPPNLVHAILAIAPLELLPWRTQPLVLFISECTAHYLHAPGQG